MQTVPRRPPGTVGPHRPHRHPHGALAAGSRAIPAHAHRPALQPRRVDRLWDIAGQQPKASRTRTAYAVLSVGLGAGLSPAEHQLITGTNVETRDGIVLIHVPGKYARTVPVLNRYAPKVAELADEQPDVPLLASSITDSRNRLNSRISRICLPPGLPNITCARLRTTWAATVLGAGVPLKEFLAL